ncbi:PREDICTED: putative leucine-rich repeat-containing protein DDB_G0290503 [Amphimedon queenslandica]|uniref:Death domain-containing protein n=1 Tax=Amphimedon queenslandica TaxID=400682 RepID=A0AAN0JLN9_AMPQE|nr:PREDICTED: putative leucine-rich repeat-containing protein DDB_G0290503 [Amphimedon queenslandica]|eukprot:XP_019857911.1 PREDICTED: putative leucine-rich repeat-containing protein DDB_G0290503 [Amphimedon queenslandica]
MACNRVITFDEFLDQKPPIKELVEQIDTRNEWLMFGVILGLTKDAIYQLPKGVITGKTEALLELWLHAPNASRRQLLEELRKDPDKKDVADNYEKHLTDTYQAECKQSSEKEPADQCFVSGQKSREELDIEEKLKTKDCVIQELQDNICNYKEQIKDFEEKLRTNNSDIENLQSTFEEKENELQAAVHCNETQKVDFEEKLKTKVQEINDLKVSIKEKDNESDSKIQELQTIIHEKEEELLSSQKLLAKKEREVNTLSEGITAKETELASFRKLSEEQLQDLVALKLKLTDNQQDIAEKESMIKSTNEELLSVRLLLSQTQEELKLQRNELEEKLKTQHRISKMKDREIESLKAMLYPRNEQDMITSIKWSESEVRLTSPSAEQCTDVLTRIDDNHQQIYLSDSSSDVAQLLIVPLLQKKSVNSLYIFSTRLRHGFIDLFSSQMLDNNTLESLHLNHNSIDDVGVITLVQSLKHNKKLQYLSLEFNTEITSLSVPSLAEFIRINCTLSVLYVASTSIDAKGVLELVDSLKFNKRLGKIVVDQKHKAICSQFVSKTNRLDFSYSSTTAYENTGITKF